MSETPVRVIPLGGIGEIGKNMICVEHGSDLVLIDAGIKFPDESLRGIDLLIPDVSYVEERRAGLRALLLTHGHEDHIGALPYLLPRLVDPNGPPLPIYGSPLTVGFVREKLREREIMSLADLRPIQPHQRYMVGPFRAEFLRVAHSIPDSMAIALHTPVGTLLFTGDFKFDDSLPDHRRTDEAGFEELGDNGVLVLFSDATRAEHPGETPSEVVVTESLDRIIASAPGRVVIATFASNIARLGDVLVAAAQRGRRVALVGRSLEQNATVALELGFLPADATLGSLDEVLSLPLRQQLLLTTGAQGEPTAALTRIATGAHPRVQIEPEDTVVISATPIPGNEETVSQTIDWLFRRGARVIYPALDPTVHVSGHASRAQLRRMLELVRPRYVVPVHGEYRHLVLYRDLCFESGIATDSVFLIEMGQPIELGTDSARLGEPVISGTLLVDRLEYHGRDRVVLRRAADLISEGIILVAVVVDRSRGELIGEPVLTAQNFEGEGVLELARSALKRELARRQEIPAYGELVGRIKDAVGRAIYQSSQRRPLIMPIIAEF